MIKQAEDYFGELIDPVEINARDNESNRREELDILDIEPNRLTTKISYNIDEEI